MAAGGEGRKGGRPGGRRRPLAARLALAGGAAVLALLLVEVALRVVGFSYPNFYRPDPRLGWALRPGESAWWTREGHAFVAVNAAGQRDRERARDKPAGTWRLALLGDSVVEAVQVPLEETFGQLLERRLAACPALAGRRVEVLNFGVAGYGTGQEYLAFTERALAYAPDAALLTFFAGNDVADNLRALDGNPRRPYFELAADGRLVYDDAFRRGRAFRTRERAGALYAVGNRLRLLQLGKAALAARRVQQQAGDGATPGIAAEGGVDELVMRPPADATWEEAWRVTEALVAATHRAASAEGVAFGVATATIPLQAHPDPAARRAVAERLGVADLDYPDRRVAALGERAGFPVLPLAPALRERAERTGEPLHGFANTPPATGHWNAAGHAAAAEALAPWVCRELVAAPAGAGRAITSGTARPPANPPR